MWDILWKNPDYKWCNNMIKKLRIKLIAVAMVSVFIVLGTIISAINIINYNKITGDADQVLGILMENNGSFPEDNRNDDKKPEDLPADQADKRKPPEEEMLPGSRELPYESRYFSVFLDTTGGVTDSDMRRIAAVDSDAAEEMAGKIFISGKTKGYYDNYRFLRYSDGDGIRIIFLDCMRSLSNFKNTLFMSIMVSLAGLAAVFVLVVIFSRRIVKPVSESYEKQKEFITNAGHEIKTPLSIINADAEVLEMENGKNEWTEDIKKQTERLTGLTNDLVFLARMQESEGENVMIDFPFSDMVSEAVKTFSAPAKMEGKTLASDIEEMINVKGDEKSLYKLVTILLDNANKYSPKGGYIHAGLRKQKGRVIFDVTNTTDYDLEEGALEHMFDRFYRADKSRNSKKGGYGIGLSVASAIVANHKGKIRAYAKDSRCIVVEVTLSA